MDVLNAFQNCDMHYKKFRQLAKKIDQDNFKYVKLSLQKF